MFCASICFSCDACVCRAQINVYLLLLTYYYDFIQFERDIINRSKERSIDTNPVRPNQTTVTDWDWPTRQQRALAECILTPT